MSTMYVEPIILYMGWKTIESYSIGLFCVVLVQNLC